MRLLGAERRLGDLHSRICATARATSSRSARAAATLLKKTRSVRLRLRGAAADRRRSSATCRDYEWRDGEWMAARAATDAWLDGRCRSTKCTSGRGRACPSEGNRFLTYRELARAARAVREGDGLHAHRAAAGDGASVLRVVGLPGDRVLRADQPLRPAGGLQGVRRRLPPGRHRRDSRLGARALSRRTRTASRGSTARRSTSTPIRGRASTRTGAR